MSGLKEHSSQPRVSGVRAVHFGVVDLPKMRDFFTKGWGLAEVAATDDTAFLRATGPEPYCVALHKRPTTEVLRVDLRVASLEGLKALHHSLASAHANGLTDIAPIEDFAGGQGFTLRDPEGRLLMILAGDQRPTPETSIDQPTKISHVVMNSATPDTEAFYIEKLGFSLVDRSRRITFLNCNSDHHSVALVPGNHSALHHIAFELPTFDALMRGAGRLRDYGTPVSWGVGRHGPGNNIFAYFIGPENLPIEYTTEVAQVDASYRVGGPDDWKFPPGRMDLWGLTPPPTPDMVKAESAVHFAR